MHISKILEREKGQKEGKGKELENMYSPFFAPPAPEKNCPSALLLQYGGPPTAARRDSDGGGGRECVGGGGQRSPRACCEGAAAIAGGRGHGEGYGDERKGAVM